MAGKDDEIDKILNEIKGAKGTSDADDGNDNSAEDTALNSTAEDKKEDETPLEPALNELPVNKKGINDFKDEYEEEEVEYVKNPAKKKNYNSRISGCNSYSSCRWSLFRRILRKRRTHYGAGNHYHNNSGSRCYKKPAYRRGRI